MYEISPQEIPPKIYSFREKLKAGNSIPKPTKEMEHFFLKTGTHYLILMALSDWG